MPRFRNSLARNCVITLVDTTSLEPPHGVNTGVVFGRVGADQLPQVVSRHSDGQQFRPISDREAYRWWCILIIVVLLSGTNGVL